jgi:hypothetical protein
MVPCLISLTDPENRGSNFLQAVDQKLPAYMASYTWQYLMFSMSIEINTYYLTLWDRKSLLRSSKTVSSCGAMIKFWTWHSDSSVGIATGYSILDGRGVGVRVLIGSIIYVLHVVQTGSRVHVTFFKMDNGGSYPRDKAARADYSPPIMPRSRKCGSIRPLPHTPS